MSRKHPKTDAEQSRLANETAITRCLDAGLSGEDFAELSDALKADAELRSDYVETCLTSSSLFDGLLRPQRVTAGSRAALANAASGNLVARLAPAAAALAALLLLAVLMRPDANDEATPVAAGAEPAEPQPLAAPPENAIGRVVKRINNVAGPAAEEGGASDYVVERQTLSLERGLMQVELNNGIALYFEGPVEFTVIDPFNGVLEFGGVGVRVPKGFSGYVVDTPSARVVDLGTEFALRVGSDGATDLRVIEGQVSVAERRRNGQLKPAEPRLLEKDAVWSSVAGIRKPEGPPSTEDFPDSQLLTDPSPAAFPACPLPDTPLLWLAADRAVKTDGDGGVLAWGDLSTEHEDHRHSAWQVERGRRPALVEGAFGQLPAIHFDGLDDCLITEPFASSNEQTIVVMTRLDELRGLPGPIPAQQIINYNGPPHLVIEYRWPANALRARAFAGYGVQPTTSGGVRAREIEPMEPLAIIYTYSYERGEAVMYLNGEFQASIAARLPIRSNRPKVLGLHRRLTDGGMRGDIAELLIFDRAVDADEVEVLDNYLRSRYDGI